MVAFWYAIATACIWGVVPILEKSGLKSTSPFVGLFYRCVGLLIGFLVLATVIVKPAEIRSIDMRSAILLMSGGFLASFAAQWIFYHALKYGEISRVVPIAGSYPLISFILGIFIFQETLSVTKGLGICAILFGVYALKIG